MKNKKMTLILILSVSTVWGLIFYRVFSASADDGTFNIQVAHKQVAYEPLDDYKRKPHPQLDLNYPDPFLINLELEKTEEAPLEIKPSPPVRTTPIKPFVYKPVVDWGAIKYTGCIVNPENKRTVSILAINGREIMFTEGQAADGVKLLKNCKDSIQVLYQQTIKFIRLQ